MKLVSILALYLYTLTACTEAVSPSGDLPPKPDWQTDAEQCSWQWHEGAGIGLWTETRRLNDRLWQVIYDESLDAFVTRIDDTVMGIAVQSFTLAPGSDVTALSQTLIESGHLQADAACEWQAIPVRPAPRTITFYSLAPKDPAALAPTAQGEVPEPVCAPYGASTHGVRCLISDLRSPDRVIFVEEAQERPLFDASSVSVFIERGS
jgi:hypothetical protein